MACWIHPDPPTLSVHWRFKAVLTDITRTGRWREAPSSPGVCNTNSPPSQNATAPRLEFNRENTRNNLTERRKKEANDRSLEGEVQISANGCYLPQRNCGKVIFSQASVSHSVHSGGGVRGGGGCIARTPPGRCCEIRSVSGRYASYWNAFLFYVIFCCVCIVEY